MLLVDTERSGWRMATSLEIASHPTVQFSLQEQASALRQKRALASEVEKAPSVFGVVDEPSVFEHCWPDDLIIRSRKLEIDANRELPTERGLPLLAVDDA